MKKRILSALLALALCLGLLPAALASDDVAETLTAAEAESKYGLSLSTDYVDFGSCYRWDDLKVITLTLTNNGSHRFDYEYRMGNPLAHSAPSGPVTIWFGKGNILEPGESVDIQVRLNPNQVGSGPLSANFKFLIDPQNASHIGPDGIAIGKSGLTLDVTDVLTIDYEVRDTSEISAKDINCDISVDAIDFGTVDSPYPSLSKTFTVTNRGSVEFQFFCRIDNDHKDKYLFDVSPNPHPYLKPGESAEVTVTTTENYYHQGPKLVVENCPLTVTAFYSESPYDTRKEENTVTTVIPMSVTLLKDGGACTIHGEDHMGGVAVTEDGHRFTGNGKDLSVAPGSDLTIHLTSWMEGYVPLALEVDGKFATSGDTYTFENIQDDMDFQIYFYNPKVPPADWAKEAAGKARVLGIRTDMIEDFSLPITREEFCEYAFIVYKDVTGDSVYDRYEYPESPYTDTDHSDILRLSKLGVITGVGDGRFDPEGRLTREQAAAILSRLAGVMEVELPSAQPTFTDNASMGSWAVDAVGQMQASGIMGGMGNNQFGPQGTYSYEQSIATLMRLYDLS